MARDLITVVLDTNALLWWTLDPQKLTKKAAAIGEVIKQRGAYLSSFSTYSFLTRRFLNCIVPSPPGRTRIIVPAVLAYFFWVSLTTRLLIHS